MTDSRPEPDKIEADLGSETRPEPVWARPTAPEPEGSPVDSAPTVEVRPTVEPAGSNPTWAEQTPVDPESAAPAAAGTTGSVDQEPASPPFPPAPTYYQSPQYPAPHGFGSPHGLGSVPESGPVSAGPFDPQPGQPGHPDGASPPDASGSAPWYTDATQSTQQFAGSGWPAQPYPVPGRRKRGSSALIALLIGACLLVGALGGVAGSALRDSATDASGRNPTISLPKPASADANRATSSVTTVAAAVLPSVVSINVRVGNEAGTGSGFVIDADKGYILTNNHVVTAGGSAAATSIQVVFQDGTQVSGKVVGLDASYDLAVVKVTAKGLRQLTLGDSDAVRVGDPVVAIGAPLGLQGTVTTGIVSALNRPVAAGEGNKPAFINAIQTDAAINPGNSGGPLVDAAGNVIAVNSAIARSPGSVGSTSGNIGLGFAIPSNQARRTAEQLIRTGKASHPIIGVSLDSNYTGRGVKVSEQAGSNAIKPVTENGPADQAGIKAGDVITKIDGRPVTEPDELIVAIRAQTPGDTITLTVLRGTSENEVRVKLSEATD